MRRTRIVCTIGPASGERSCIEKLIKAGMNVARLNFSHGTYDQHLEKINLIRAVADELNVTVGIMQDLSGPKIRIGKIAGGPAVLKRDAHITFKPGEFAGDSEKVSLPFPDMLKQMKRGQVIFLDDAKIELRVVSSDSDSVTARVVVPGELSSNKGVTAPGLAVRVSGVTEKDRNDLRFGLQNGVDWVASSFVRSAVDIEPLRAVMKEEGRSVPVVAKIERPEAVKDIQRIIEEYDAIMVARGDLGIELPIHEVPAIQKKIISLCNRAGKPVIIATQMLDSMMSSSRPTRAEVTDIANAILDGADATMLSGETAAGAYPVESVQMMHKVACSAEKLLDHDAILQRLGRNACSNVTEGIGEAAVSLAKDLGADAIITCTYSGTTARLVSKFRPKCQVIAAASNVPTARRLTMSWGIYPICVEKAEDTDSLIANALIASKAEKLIKKGDTVVIIAGVPVGAAGNTSLVRVIRV